MRQPKNNRVNSSFFLLFITMLFVACGSLEQSISNKESIHDFRILIHQMLVDPECVYVVTNDKIEVYNVVYRWNKFKYKKRYSTKLTAQGFERLQVLRNDLVNLEEHYEKPMLGGVIWIIKLQDREVEKQITLDNKQIPITDSLFVLVNTFLPKNVPKLLLR